MDKAWAIFDLDGTIIDSMRYWRELGREYLEYRGMQGDLTQLLERIKPMTMLESAALFHEECGLPESPRQIAREMDAMMARHYRTDIALKPGVAEYLRRLREDGVWLCIATITPEPLARMCLERLGIADLFAFILSCDAVSAGKDRPDVFLEAAWRLAADPEEIAVFEDAYYAARTAKQAGFYVVGVYDASGDRHWKDMQRIADETIADWRDVI